MRSRQDLRTAVAEATGTYDVDMTPPSWALYGIIHLNVTAVPGTAPTFDMKLQYCDPQDNTKVQDWPGAGITQITAAGYIVWTIGAPSLADDDTGPVYSNALPLAGRQRARIVTGGTGTFSYTLTVEWVG